MTMNFRQAICDALSHADPPPPGESATRFRIIDPLLRELGYSLREVDPEQVGAAGERPDYVILSGSLHTWFLEAKSWNLPLQDKEALQATSYAFNTGKRWAVLTNGRVWRLYDSSIQGLPGDRLVAEAQLDDLEGAEAFLSALSRTSVTTGGLERFAIQSRLTAVLRAELADANSRIVRDICRVLRTRAGLETASGADVVSYFEGLSTFRQRDRYLPEVVEPPREEPLPDVLDGKLSLSHLAADEANCAGRKPLSITMPDGTNAVTSTWREMAVEVVSWLAHRGKVPVLPFRGGSRGDRYFLNTTPHHRTGVEFKERRVVRAGDVVVYVHVHRSARDLIGRICDVCEAVGESAEAFKVALGA
jgi:hypothetical protein